MTEWTQCHQSVSDLLALHGADDAYKDSVLTAQAVLGLSAEAAKFINSLPEIVSDEQGLIVHVQKAQSCWGIHLHCEAASRSEKGSQDKGYQTYTGT